MWDLIKKYWPKLSDYGQFLTKNERNKLYLRLNSKEGRLIADSKYKTKVLLNKKKVAVPRLMFRLKSEKELDKFDWKKLDGNFVVKPASGYGGDGILIIRSKSKRGDSFIKMDRKTISISDLSLHCRDILAGKYSMHSLPDTVLIEERIKIHPKFFAYTRSGTPDIRVILYHAIPVMSMLRVPTEKSLGRANLEQGAMGLGIDLANGLTTFGVLGKDQIIETIYNFRKKNDQKISGIRIPEWRLVMERAIAAARAVPELEFVGVDLVLDKEVGPVVLELNARPGLSIQICNRAGLRLRMEKVEGIQAKSVSHAYNLARYLFGERLERTELKKEVVVVKPIERISIKIGRKKNQVIPIRAKIDTGAYRSSIDRDLAEKLKLLDPDKILYTRHFKSSLGRDVDRPVIGVTFYLAGKLVRSQVGVAPRGKLKTKFLIGRRDLRGFVVKLKAPKKKKKQTRRVKNI